ncbi:hypothetical protein D9M70_343660 [compost metagenome]
MALADTRSGPVQARLRRRAEQPASHAQGGEDGNAALQEDAQRAVEACQLVEEHPPVHRRHALQPLAEQPSEGRLADQQDQRRDARQQAAEQRVLVGMQEQPGVHQHLRQPRQVRAQALEHQAEARHHVADQEQQHAAADDQQQQRVDRGADDLLAQLVHALPVGDVAAQRIAHRAGLLAGLHQRHVEGREHRRELAQCLGERLALVEQAHQLAEQLARMRRGLLLGQAFQGVDQRQAGVQQGGQLLAEQHQVEALALPPAQQRTPLGAQREHAQALVLGQAPGLRRAGRLQAQLDHLGGAADALDVIAHRATAS